MKKSAPRRLKLQRETIHRLGEPMLLEAARSGIEVRPSNDYQCTQITAQVTVVTTGDGNSIE